MIAPCWYI